MIESNNEDEVIGKMELSNKILSSMMEAEWVDCGVILKLGGITGEHFVESYIRSELPKLAETVEYLRLEAEDDKYIGAKAIYDQLLESLEDAHNKAYHLYKTMYRDKPDELSGPVSISDFFRNMEKYDREHRSES